MRKNFRKAALSTICMLVVAIMSLTGATYAWFSAAETADVTGLEVNVASAEGGFQVSKTGVEGTWTSTIDFTGDEHDALQPVSTVDAIDFFTAKVDSNDPTGKKITTTADTDKVNVWTQTFYAKNTGYDPVTVYMAAGEIFQDANTTDSKAGYQAARMAVYVDKDGAGTEFPNTLMYIWGAGDTNLGIDAAGTIEDYTKETAGLVGTVEALKTELRDCSFELAGMKVEGNTATPYIATITMMFWIEGQDAECINQNASDTFNVDIDLTVTAPTGEEVGA